MRGRREAAASILAIVLASLCAASSAIAAGAPRVRLKMRFSPDRLGASTTIHWGFTIAEPTPLRSISLRLPPGMGYLSSSLGLEVCDAARLNESGLGGCPVDSHIGFGSALAVVPAQANVQEQAQVTALFGPQEGEDLTVLFFIDGNWPANRELVLTSHLSNISAPGGATLLTEVPQLPVWPEGPDIRLISLRSTIGPEGLTYYRRARGRTVAFKPRGVSVPDRCPSGGFPVRATFSWWTTSATSTARTRVPCPHRRG